jgi:hypothetical protein
MRVTMLLLCCLALAACSVVALPFRVAGDVISIVPIVGKPIGGAIRGVGDVID